MSDLDSSLAIPPFLALTQLRPDVIIFSPSTKTVIILELTCPCEENMETWHSRKKDKYVSLCSEIKRNGWATHFFAIEVGARGYCAESVRYCLKRLGFRNKLCRTTLKSLSSASLRSSFYIWLTRNSRDWKQQQEVTSFENFKISKEVPSFKEKKSSCIKKSTINTKKDVKSFYSTSKIPSKSSGGSSYKFSSSFPLPSISEEQVCPSPVPRVNSSKVSSSLASAVLSTGCFSPGVKAKKK